MGDFPVFDDERARWLAGKLHEALASTWHVARGSLLAGRSDDVDAPNFPKRVRDDSHDGAPQREIDRELNEHLRVLGPQMFRDGAFYGGEEEPPTLEEARAIESDFLIVADPLDGTQQAYSLPGCWSINVVVQQRLGTDDATGFPTVRFTALATIDAVGVTTIGVDGRRLVEMRLAGDDLNLSDEFNVSDVLEIPIDDSDGGDDSVPFVDADSTGLKHGSLSPTVLVGGYKPNATQWDQFRDLRERMLDHSVFNTAGAPVVHKLLTNPNLVVVQLGPSALWDGIAAGLISRAGGTVVPIGSAEPVSWPEVRSWFSEFGWTDEPQPDGTLTKSRPVPGFVAGLRRSHVVEVATRANEIRYIADANA